ncbi:MAG TPA: hypothetical protein VN153_01405 [Tahibacter sp.]|nr:hypothetical protein [Tahibacter sp.]
MRRYVSKSGKPFGATGFRLEPDAIVVRFKGDQRYRYTHASCGVTHVDAMKRLAIAGEGLSTYVAQHQPRYAERF